MSSGLKSKYKTNKTNRREEDIFMNPKSLKLSKEEIEQLKEMTAQYEEVTPPEYANYVVTDDKLRIIIYDSKKVVFIGENAMSYYEEFLGENDKFLKFPQAGSDEVGKGEFIGPMCITAAYVDEEIYKKIEHLTIKDSKEMDKMKVIEIAKELELIVPHETIIIDNKTYNEIRGLGKTSKNNQNTILAKAHNKAYIELNKKIELPKPVIIDDAFGEKIKYFDYLAEESNIYEDIALETEAEGKYISVAIAAYLATYAHYKEIKKMEERYDFKFKVGSGPETNHNIKEFLKLYPESELENVVKKHFSNYDKIIESARKEDIIS